MSQTTQRIRNCELFKGLDQADVERIIAGARTRDVDGGEVIVREGEPGERMFIVVEGRFKVTVEDVDGQERILNFLAAGSHFGELSMLIAASRSATITAVLDGRLLEINRRDFNSLIESVPAFAVNLSRSIGRWLHRQAAGNKQHDAPSTIALVRASPGSCRLAGQLAGSLTERGIEVAVATDRPGEWNDVDVALRRRLPEGADEDAVAAIREMRYVARRNRLLVDVDIDRAEAALLMQCERVWWLIDADDHAEALARLRELIRVEMRLAARVQLVWRIPMGERLPPAVEHDIPTPHQDLRVGYIGENRARYRAADIARLGNLVKGIQICLALGGGGARGMSHVGVLRAFDNAGVYFDRIAGTSAGAIVASLYAAGYSQEVILELFEKEMSPPWWARWIPKGRRLHLLAVFRLGWAERSFRKYLFDYRFEQLLTPIHTMSVDLVSGKAIVRENGDVVRAVCESVNLPGLARPILSDGRALVDGGVLENVPARVLREREADFIVAIDIGARLAKRFAGSTGGTPDSKMKRPGFMETILRVIEVQQHGLVALHKAECDMLIAPDTSEFLFDDFTCGPALADVGEEATAKAIPRLKERLAAIEAEC